METTTRETRGNSMMRKERMIVNEEPPAAAVNFKQKRKLVNRRS